MSVELEMAVSEQLPSGVYVPDAERCRQWVQAALEDDDDCIASVQIVTVDEMQQLNRDYRGKDAPTNVLSFTMQVPAEVGLNLLGDLVLCAEVIAHEAAAQHKTLDAHWAHMLVHGMLHLQGHDHVEDDEAARMEAREIAILRRLGFDNPYLDHSEKTT